MDNYETLLTRALKNRNTSVRTLRGILIKIAENCKMKVNRLGYENLQNDLQELINSGKFPEKYKGNKNINIDTLSKYLYYTLSLLRDNIGNFRKFEDTSELDENKTSWLRVDSQENSSVSIYTISNALEILVFLGAIDKVKDSVWISKNSKRNLCSRYNVNESSIVRYLEACTDFINISAPEKVKNKYISKIESAEDYEVCVMASTLATTIDTKTYKRAWERILLNRVSLDFVTPETSPETLEEQRKLDDKKIGITLREARLIVQLNNFDITTIAAVHHDTYGGRLYHKWSTVKTCYREKAKLRGALSRNSLVEVDLSQCNFYILYSLFVTKTDNVPTKLLALAVQLGKLREVIAISAHGKYSDVICGKEINIDFDKITNLQTAKKFKDELKLFFLKASNCKFGSEAGHIMDEALAKIDSEFARWIRNYRKGFTIYNELASGKQSVVPYMTQQNEVEFMFGRKMNHALPIKGELVVNTDYKFERTQRGVVDFLIECGVKYFLPIHDAIIITSDNVKYIFDAIRSAAIYRNYSVPAIKVISYKTGDESRYRYPLPDSFKSLKLVTSLRGYDSGSDQETIDSFKRLRNCYRSLKRTAI